MVRVSARDEREGRTAGNHTQPGAEETEHWEWLIEGARQWQCRQAAARRSREILDVQLKQRSRLPETTRHAKKRSVQRARPAGPRYVQRAQRAHCQARGRSRGESGRRQQNCACASDRGGHAASPSCTRAGIAFSTRVVHALREGGDTRGNEEFE